MQLRTGQLLKVRPFLVKRQKQHFHHLKQYDIDIIIGCNGFIWIGEHNEVNPTESHILVPHKKEEKNCRTKYICTAANAVRVLSNLRFTITLEVINEVIELSLSLNLETHDMLGSEFSILVAEKEVERRILKKRKR